MKSNIATPGMCLSVGARIATKLGAIEADYELVETFLKEGEGHPFFRVISDYFVRKLTVSAPPSEILAMLRYWEAFYAKFFGIEIDLSSVPVPEKKAGFDRLIVIARGICLNRVWNAHKGREIQTWQWWSGPIEKVMQKSERGIVKSSYAFWVRNGQEGDAEMMNLSAEMIAESADKIEVETILERLVHGLKYFDETGQHLDVKSVTLCARSRFADGDVPSVYRDYDGRVCVNGYNPSGRDSCLRARQAVR
jgi:hypothetical protein